MSLSLDHIWPPFTALEPTPEAIKIVKGKGTKIFDDEGNSYIDAVSSWWVNPLGHCHDGITQAIKNQLDQLEHVIMAGFVHPPALELADSLMNITHQKFEKVFFSDNGSTSVEVALKMAVQYFENSGKPKTTFIAFEKAYHGDTFGAMSVGGEDVFFSAFNAFRFQIKRIPIPTDENIDEVKAQLEDYLKEDDVAAFIYEPLLQGSAGMRMYSSVHLDSLLDIVTQYGAVSIADEVMTGFGRTGKMFATDYLERNSPDIICLSKCLTGGYLPLGITMANEKIVQPFLSKSPEHTLYHGHSYTGNPLSCSAAVASLAEFAKPEVQGNWARINEKHQEFAKQLKQDDRIENVRVLGTVIAWEINQGESGYLNPIKQLFTPHFLKSGVLLRPLGNTIYILPPYCITNEELEQTYSTCLAAMNLL